MKHVKLQLTNFLIVCLLLIAFSPLVASQQDNCTDSDGSLDAESMFVKGYVSGTLIPILPQDMPKEDLCLNEMTLRELLCIEGLIDLMNIDCPNGCRDGTCLRDTTTTTTTLDTCRDSDGVDIYVKGVCYDNVNCKDGCFDQCLNDKQFNLITQYKCLFGHCSPQTYACSVGYVCWNNAGACRPMNCQDSDGPQNYDTTGTVYGSYDGVSFSYQDYCDGDKAVDNLCDSFGVPAKTSSLCINGCNDGACRKEPTTTTTLLACTDSDRGVDYYAYGVVVSSVGNQWADSCALVSDSGTQTTNQCTGPICAASEHACQHFTSSTKTFDGIYYGYDQCPNGCKDGACIQTTTTTLPESAFCNDSDGGIDYYWKGELRIPGFQFYDRCDELPNSPDTLLEYYCSGTTGQKVKFTCPNGCSDGVCIQTTTTTLPESVFCTDSDGGQNYAEKGILNTNTPTWEPIVPDKCATQSSPGEYSNTPSCSGSDCVLIELYCQGSVPERSFHRCPSGCIDGVCVTGSCASNSDCPSGKFCELSGCPGTQPVSGACADKPLQCLMSYDPVCSCDGYTYQNDCFRKKDGKALKIRSTCYTTTTLPGVCSDSDGGLDYYRRGQATMGGNSQADACTIGPGYNMIEGYCRIEDVAGRYYNCPKGCYNGACIASNEPYCNFIGGDSEGWYIPSGRLKAGKCNGCASICKNVGTRSEGWYNSCDDSLISFLACGQTTTTTIQSGCYDPDLENIYHKGTVTMGDIYAPHEDYCEDKDTLAEYICEQNPSQVGNIYQPSTPKKKLVNCPFGCSGGRCLYECKTSQIIGDVNADSMVNDIDARILTELFSANNMPQDLCCLDANHDHSLNNEDVQYIKKIAAGLYHSPGVCGAGQDQCTDSPLADAQGNKYIKGSCVRMKDGVRTQDEDTCINEESLREVYCDGDEIKVKYVPCEKLCRDGACQGGPMECQELKGKDTCLVGLTDKKCYWDAEKLICESNRLPCEDSDVGSNYNERGTTYGFESDIAQSREAWSDDCINESSLLEYYCKDRYIVGTETVDCKNGCKLGSCKEDVGDYCRDTDGGAEIFKTGMVNWRMGESKTVLYDSCCQAIEGQQEPTCNLTEGGLLSEADCREGKPSTELIKCPKGCKDGSCIRAQEGQKVGIMLKKGWNLITFPGKGSLSKGTCTKVYGFVYIDGVYLSMQDAEKKLKTGLNDYVSKHAAWVYSMTDCSMDYTVESHTSSRDVRLGADWNFVPVTEDLVGKGIEEFGQDCMFSAEKTSRSFYLWDSSKQDWRVETPDYRFTEADVLSGVVSSGDGCISDGGPSEIPQLPES